MRIYGQKKRGSSRGKHRAHNGRCHICEPDNPSHGTARQRNKVELRGLLKEEQSK
jgi:hypothetical protein